MGQFGVNLNSLFKRRTSMLNWLHEKLVTMKRRILYLFCLVLCLTCCEPNGSLIPTPEGLDQAVQDQLNADKRHILNMTGLSVRAYPKDVYYVIADANQYWRDRSRTAPLEPKASKSFIAQKALQGTTSYWQVTEATPEQMKLLGVK